MKRLFDVAFAAISVLVLFPIFMGLALVIKAASPGPVFYRGIRVGRNGKQFRIVKFRSMIVNADRVGGSSTSNGDPRVTSIGRFMRKYKLDELPQVFNVLYGSMSFVGPRPEVQEYVDAYTDEEKLILTIRPGITDWASIWNSDEGAVLAHYKYPDCAYLELIRPTKLKLQLMYARNNSLWIDLKILVYTLRKIVSSDWTPRELILYGNLLATCNSSPEQQKAA